MASLPRCLISESFQNVASQRFKPRFGAKKPLIEASITLNR